MLVNVFEVLYGKFLAVLQLQRHEQALTGSKILCNSKTTLDITYQGWLVLQVLVIVAIMSKHNLDIRIDIQRLF
jgi:hypothetical protein